MKFKMLYGLVGLLIATPTVAGCVPVEHQKQLKGSHWQQATKKQEYFLKGIFAMNPDTHKGLPIGDKVFIITKEGKETTLALWTDYTETLSCDMMLIPKELMEILNQVDQSGGDDM